MNTEYLSKFADALTDAPRKYRIAIKHPTRFDRILIRLRLRKPFREFELKPLVLGKLVLISQLLLRTNTSLDRSEFKGPAFIKLTNELVVKSAHDLAEILAIAVCSDKRPSEKLVEFLFYNLSLKELKEAVEIVMEQADFSSFLSGIISVKMLNILEVNPDKVEESKASTPLSVA